MTRGPRSVQRYVPADGWCAMDAAKRFPLDGWAVTKIDTEYSRVFGMFAETDSENGLCFADRLEVFEKYDRLGKKKI